VTGGSKWGPRAEEIWTIKGKTKIPLAGKLMGKKVVKGENSYSEKLPFWDFVREGNLMSTNWPEGEEKAT